MLPAWMRRFPLHLVRVKPIQIAVEGHPCLDELHESRKNQALIKIGPDKDIQAPIKIGTGDMQETAWADSGQSEQKR